MNPDTTPSSIAAVGLVKNEADIIGSTLLHLYGLGIRRFVIAELFSGLALACRVAIFHSSMRFRLVMP